MATNQTLDQEIRNIHVQKPQSITENFGGTAGILSAYEENDVHNSIYNNAKSLVDALDSSSATPFYTGPDNPSNQQPADMFGSFSNVGSTNNNYTPPSSNTPFGDNDPKNSDVLGNRYDLDGSYTLTERLDFSGHNDGDVPPHLNYDIKNPSDNKIKDSNDLLGDSHLKYLDSVRKFLDNNR